MTRAGQAQPLSAARHTDSALCKTPGTAWRPPLSSVGLRGLTSPAQPARRIPHGMSTRMLLERRLAGVRDDDAFLVIAVEGGGLRGVVSGAMLIALDDLGITRVADAIVGTSAGAINVAYHAAGLAWDALAAYYDLIPTHLLRPAWEAFRQPLLRMNYLDQLFTQDLPLCPEHLRRYPVPVFATVTDVDQQRTVAVPLTADVDVHAWLKASSWLPVLAGRPLSLDGRRWLDGGVLCPNLVTAADLFPATHVLSICSRPDAVGGPAVGEWLVRPILNNWSAGLGDRFIQLRRQWAADAAQLGSYTDGTLRGSRVLRLTPHPHRVGRLTRDAGLLLEGTRRGYARVMEYFGGDRASQVGIGYAKSTKGHAPRPATAAGAPRRVPAAAAVGLQGRDGESGGSVPTIRVAVR
jgi:patatin-like phospholipase